MYRLIKRTVLLFMVFLSGSYNGHAQQVVIFNNNITNPFSTNPAMAGYHGSNVFLQQRNQWIGMDDAPVNTLLTAEWRLGKSRSALGFSLSKNRAAILDNTSSYATYASHFRIGKEQYLSFGLSAGIRNNSILFDRVNALEGDDPLLFDYNQAGTSFDAAFGMAYHWKSLEVQLASMQLLASSSVFSSSFEQKELAFDYVRHYFGSVAYEFKIKNSYSITPILQARNVNGFNIQPEAAVRLGYKDFLWTALKYNYLRSVDLTVGVAISEKFVVGYSAEFAASQFAKHSGGSHEILFGIRLGKSHQPEINKNEIEKLKRDSRSYDERLEYLKRENERLRLEIKEQKKLIEELQKSGASYEEIKKALEEYNRKLELLKESNGEE
jgi:type IX secretion system PorP/SprF family membrane protein